MKKILFSIIAILHSPLINGQDIIDLYSGKILTAGNTSPTRTVVQYADSVIVSYDFSSAKIVEDDLFPGTIWWMNDGFSLNDTPGEASLPVKLDRFEIPTGYFATVSIIDSSFVEFSYELTPARQPLIDSGNEYYTKDNVHEIYSYSGFDPISIIDAKEVQTYRNITLQNVRVYPIQYDYLNKTIRAYTHIKYKITYCSNTEDTNEISGMNVNGQIELLEESAENANYIRQDYLIITTNEFVEAAEKFAEWKKMLGFNVHLEVGDSWTSDSIKTTVVKTYEQYPNLYYLLIIGDNDDVPGQISTRINSHVTDLYYGCLSGISDYTPEIYRGRISVSTLDEANNVIDKIINYEKNPPLDTCFYDSGLNCAYFQDDNLDGYADRRFAQTSEEIRDYVILQGKSVERVYFAESNASPLYWNNGSYSNGENIPSELLKPNFAWSGNSSDIINAINYGRFYVLHRDHGAITYWGDPYFHTSYINQLSNGQLLPIVFSLNCLTGKFNYNGICFAEAFLRKQNGGCVAIFGATELSYSGYNDALAVGMFDAIWKDPGLRIKFGFSCAYGEETPTPTYRLGQILDQGLNRMQETYGAKSSYYSIYQREIFHCFGDPSMRIYTSTPADFSNVTINRSLGSISVDLNEEVADITFYDHKTGDVLCYHGTKANYTSLFPQFVSICISGHNKIPYLSEGKIPSHIYIQNETISSNKNYDADFITIGTNVTDTKPNGDVIIQNSEVSMSASQFVIQPNVSISSDAKISLTIK